MEVQILEIENGVSSVFTTLTISKFRTMEMVIELCATRNRRFGNENRTYVISCVEVAA